MKDDVPSTISDLYEYSGFWPRVGASLIDTVSVNRCHHIPVLISGLRRVYFDNEALVKASQILCLVGSFQSSLFGFLIYRQATPGKWRYPRIRRRNHWR